MTKQKLPVHTHPLVICGPSGSGKTFLANYLVANYPFKLVLSTMTRRPRAGEVHMVHNEYVTKEQFDAIQHSGDFFMVNEFFGSWYAYRRSFVREIQAQGFAPVAIVYTPIVDQWFGEFPDSLGVFLDPASLDLLRRRMELRGDSSEQIAKRLAGVVTEREAFERHISLFKMTFAIADDDDVYDVVSAIVNAYRVQ